MRNQRYSHKGENFTGVSYFNRKGGANMAKIIITNQQCQIVDATIPTLKALDKAMSVKTPGCEFTPTYRSGKWNGMTNFFNVANGKFPAGLLQMALGILSDRGEAYKIEDKRKPLDIKIPDKVVLNDEGSTITLRDYQYEAVISALHLKRGVINVATNGGKTEIACGIMQQALPCLGKNDRILFFTHSKEIFSQAVERISKRLKVPVGQIGSGKWEEEQITVVMIPTIAKYMTKTDKVPNTKKYKDMKEKVEQLNSSYVASKGVTKELAKTSLELAIAEKNAYEKEKLETLNEMYTKTGKLLKNTKMFIGDEVHHASSDTWYKLFKKIPNAVYRFGLTGTVDKSNPVNVMKLHASTGDIIAKVSNEYLITNGYSAKPIINMLSLDDIPSISSRFYAEERRDGIVENKQRNSIFVRKIVERFNHGKQCLVIVNETEHGDIVLNMLKNEIDSVEFIHGQRTSKAREQALQALRDGELRVLISTSILDEGVDVSSLNCIFLMAGGKSMRQLLQRIGRGLRKKADGSHVDVYDALDYHGKYLVEHLAERYDTYVAEGFEIKKL